MGQDHVQLSSDAAGAGRSGVEEGQSPTPGGAAEGGDGRLQAAAHLPGGLCSVSCPVCSSRTASSTVAVANLSVESLVQGRAWDR